LGRTNLCRTKPIGGGGEKKGGKKRTWNIFPLIRVGGGKRYQLGTFSGGAGRKREKVWRRPKGGKVRKKEKAVAQRDVRVEKRGSNRQSSKLGRVSTRNTKE